MRDLVSGCGDVSSTPRNAANQNPHNLKTNVQQLTSTLFFCPVCPSRCPNREAGKLISMRQLIQGGLKPPVLIFVQSKTRAIELYKELVFFGVNVDAIHAERTQEQRDKIIQRFRVGEIWVLICTDLMSRGIDFKCVNMVINYDFPQSAVSYIHRIGRTGRAGRKGVAITFFTESDMEYLRSIANVMRISGCEVRINEAYLPTTNIDY